MTKWQAIQLIFNALFCLTMVKSAARLHTEGFEQHCCRQKLRSTSCFQHLVLFVEFMMYNQQQNRCTSTFITAVKFKWSALWSIFGAIKTEGHHPLFIHHYLAPVPTATGGKAGINPPQVTSPLKSTHAIHSRNYLESPIESHKNSPFWTVGGDQISKKPRHFCPPFPSLTFKLIHNLFNKITTQYNACRIIQHHRRDTAHTHIV